MWHTLWELDEHSWMVSVPRHSSERVFHFYETLYSHVIVSPRFIRISQFQGLYNTLILKYIEEKTQYLFLVLRQFQFQVKHLRASNSTHWRLGCEMHYETWQILLWQCHHDLSSQMTEPKATDCNFKAFTTMMSHSRSQHNQRGRVSRET